MLHAHTPIRIFPARTEHWFRAVLQSVAVMWLLTGNPASVNAQAESVTLTVQCQTVAGEPVTGVVVTVFDVASDTVLLRGTTDGNGNVRFPQIPPGEVRVRLAGTLESGISLRHTRQDQRGIWVDLPAHDWVMELRADTDGLVFPDLGLGNAGAADAEVATAISMGTLATVGPTTVAVASMPRATAQPTIGTTVVTAVAQPVAVQSYRPGLLVLLVLLGTIGGTIWLLARSTV